jgi:hypothetical protein
MAGGVAGRAPPRHRRRSSQWAHSRTRQGHGACPVPGPDVVWLPPPGTSVRLAPSHDRAGRGLGGCPPINNADPRTGGPTDPRTGLYPNPRPNARLGVGGRLARTRRPSRRAGTPLPRRMGRDRRKNGCEGGARASRLPLVRPPAPLRRSADRLRLPSRPRIGEWRNWSECLRTRTSALSSSSRSSLPSPTRTFRPLTSS